MLLLAGVLFAVSGSGSGYLLPRFWLSPSGYLGSPFQTTLIWSAGYGQSSMYAMTGPLYIDFPQIFDYSPVSNTVVNGTINLTCNASDADWLKNVTFYSNHSGSYQAINYTSLSAHIDSAKYEITPTTDFVWSCRVCDVFGYCTDLANQTIYYNVSIPNVTLYSPPNNTVQVPGNTNFTCNASDPNGISKINITIWKSGSLFYSNYTNISGAVNASASFEVLLTVGSYEWNCSAEDTAGYVGYSNATYTLTVFSASDAYIHEAYVDPHLITNGSSVNLFINASNANDLYANVTYPNGSIVQVTLTNESNTSFSDTALIGRYNVTFVANNTATGNYIISRDFFISTTPINFSLFVYDHNGNGISSCLEMNFYNHNYVDLCNTSGRFNLTNIPDWIYNTSIHLADNYSFVNMTNFNTSADNNKSLGLDYNSQATSVTYGFNASFSSPSQYYLQMYLSIPTPIDTYKCSSFDFSTLSCNSPVASTGAVSGSYIVYTQLALGEEGYYFEQYTAPPPPSPSKDRMDIDISSTGCVEDPVTIQLLDAKDGDLVRGGMITITGPESYSRFIRGAKTTLNLPYSGHYKVEGSASGYKDKRTSFDLYSCYECSTNDDCADNEVCEDNQCVSITCDCGYISNHKCHKYDCCSDDDCAVGYCYEHECIECLSNDECSVNEYCSENRCEPLDCGCGYALDHICVSYECCSDNDCPESHICSNHTCEYVSVEVDVPPVVIEGQEYNVTVYVNDEPVVGQVVSVNGIEYVTNGNGQIKVRAGSKDMLVTYEGVSGASALVKVKKILNLSISTSGVEFFKDIPITIIPIDRFGNPVRAEITVRGPDGVEIPFGEVTSVNFVPSRGGTYYVEASAPGYVSAHSSFNVGSCELYGLDFGKWSIYVDMCWYMWLVVFAIIVGVVMIIWNMRKPKKGVLEVDRVEKSIFEDI